MLGMRYPVWPTDISEIKGHQAAFSLIEVIISMLILSILMLSVGMMFTRGRGYIKGQGDRRIALALAEHRLEEISTMTFSQLEAFDAVPNDGDPLIYDNTENPPNDTFVGGVPLDGTGGLPDYSYFNCQTVLEYAEVVTNATGFEVTTCPDDTCLFIRARVTVSLTDAQEDSGLRGYFGPVVLEGVISDWGA
jgi:prepilin-type N-terminal cleavage/methylation domain-containing protein